MKATAHTRYVRVTPQKARRIMNEVRGMEANKALDVLKFAPQKPALPIRKTLVSALANAEQAARNAGTSFDSDAMYVIEAYVNDGPTMKRFRARAQGRGARILKRTSHLTIVVGDAEDKKELAAPYLPSQRRPEADRISASAAKKAAAAAVTKKAAKPVEAKEESAAKSTTTAKKAPAKKPAAAKSTTTRLRPPRRARLSPRLRSPRPPSRQRRSPLRPRQRPQSLRPRSRPRPSPRLRRARRQKSPPRKALRRERSK